MNKTPRLNIQVINGLLGSGQRFKWIVVAVLALVAAVLELAGALLILLLVGTIASPDEAIGLPVVGEIRSHFEEVPNETFVLAVSITVAVFFVLRSAFIIMQRYAQNRVAQNAGVRLATRLFRGYVRMPYALHLQGDSAEVIRNVQTATVQVVNSIFVPLTQLLSESLVALAILIALVIASPLATLMVVVVLGFVIALLLRYIHPKVTRFGELTNVEGRIAVKSIQEALQNAREIKLFGREAFFESRFEASKARLAKAIYQRATLAEVPRVLTETLLIWFILTFLAVSLIMGRELPETLAVLGLFAYAGLRLLPSVNKVVDQLNSLRYGSHSVELLRSELEKLEDFTDVQQADNRLGIQETLDLDQVTFFYEGSQTPALDRVSATIRRGELVGIVGPTGSGKSTLVDVILGLLEPHSGEVRVNGISIHDSPSSWQRALGAVPQTVYLLDDTISNNVAFALNKRKINVERVKSVLETARLLEFVESLPEGIETVVGERGIRLSGGERQRVAVARALYQEPDVLIFDEATSALDNLTEAELMSELTKRQGRTVILVAHRLSTVRQCDKIIVLDRGHVVSSGSYDELLSSSRLFRDMVTRGENHERDC